MIVKRSTAILLCILILFGCLGAFSVLPKHPHAPQGIEELRSQLYDARRIIHAGGFLITGDGEQVRYTNSYDALENMYALGNRVCEIDIRKTSDGVLICAHGDEAILAEGTELPVSAAAEEFLSAALFGEFRPMSVSMLADFMRLHDDLMIITDVRGDNMEICREIADSYPDLVNRFIIQIYHEREYDPIRKEGFPYIIYTLYRADDEERNLWRISNFADKHALVGITIQNDQFYSLKNRIAMIHSGLPFMFHTVDDPEEMAQMLKKPYVCAVYTDLTE